MAGLFTDIMFFQLSTHVAAHLTAPDDAAATAFLDLDELHVVSSTAAEHVARVASSRVRRDGAADAAGGDDDTAAALAAARSRRKSRPFAKIRRTVGVDELSAFRRNRFVVVVFDGGGVRRGAGTLPACPGRDSAPAAAAGSCPHATTTSGGGFTVSGRRWRRRAGAQESVAAVAVRLVARPAGVSDGDGTVVAGLQFGAGLVEGCQLTPAGLHRTASGDSMTLAQLP